VLQLASLSSLRLGQSHVEAGVRKLWVASTLSTDRNGFWRLPHARLSVSDIWVFLKPTNRWSSVILLAEKRNMYHKTWLLLEHVVVQLTLTYSHVTLLYKIFTMPVKVSRKFCDLLWLKQIVLWVLLFNATEMERTLLYTVGQSVIGHCDTVALTIHSQVRLLSETFVCFRRVYCMCSLWSVWRTWSEVQYYHLFKISSPSKWRAVVDAVMNFGFNTTRRVSRLGWITNSSQLIADVIVTQGTALCQGTFTMLVNLCTICTT
jgi:hypothetical protein